MTVEDSFVGSLTADHAEWSITGSSPYLQNTDADYIRTFSDHKLHGHFGFPTSAGSGTISSVTIRIESQISVLPEISYLEVFIFDGTSWTSLGSIWHTQTGYKYYDLDATSTLNTWAKINACMIELKSHNIEAVTMYARRGVRRTDYGVAPAGNPNSVQIMAHRREAKLEARRMPRCQPRNLNVPFHVRRF